MKRLIFTLLLSFSAFVTALCQSYNDKADNIIGQYEIISNGEKAKVAVTKNQSGNYDIQIYWLENPYNPDGSRALDLKNPDKSLRTVPMDKVVLVRNLGYDKAKKQWSGAKIYDPSRGIRANVVCTLNEKNNLYLRATILGIGESQEWKRINDR